MSINLANAYEGFEADSNFTSREALEDYRRMVLSKSAQKIISTRQMVGLPTAGQREAASV